MTEDAGSICAIILAAGESKRYGPENKLLVELDGVAVLERVVRCILHSGVSKICVVTGGDHEAVVSLLSNYEIDCVNNPNWKSGMGTSLAKGVQGIDPRDFTGIMVCLGDLPYLELGSVKRVLARFCELNRSRVALPVYNGRRGHPVVFPISYMDSLAKLECDEGARSIIQQASEYLELVTVDSGGVVRDLDLPDDLVNAES
ncbi:nucleotidyltransferase family protein [Opitutia bacterium ISCC 51]|nr:nucleotidyltransferase family protein [Opitutae bacterium ISCC 51]QXD29413.1 nucleotidyltransferase family protein [Opitutae bacterium ISCC 52]